MVDSRKAGVAAATTMMATDKANYVAALKHINNKRLVVDFALVSVKQVLTLSTPIMGLTLLFLP